MFTTIARVLFFILLLVAGRQAIGQIIDPTPTFKTIHHKSYLRFYYDNDFFTKTDYYYTQGITVEYVHPSLKKNPVSKILIAPAGSQLQYGMAFNLFGYTPTSIGSNEILYGDRPFASCMALSFFQAASDSVHLRRFSSSLSVGIIGPAAQGKEIQTGIHRWLNNILPKGWQYQVKNDLIVNYRVGYEKKLVSINHAFVLNAAAEIKAGTLNDKISTGFNFMTGHFNDPFRDLSKSRKKIEYYFYGQSRLHAIGYDASLQGGLFNRSSPYTIAAADITRISFQADAGIVVNFRKLYACYSQSYLTKEFRTGLHHRWGGISIGCAL
jgi:hypothetical protein